MCGKTSTTEGRVYFTSGLESYPRARSDILVTLAFLVGKRRVKEYRRESGQLTTERIVGGEKDVRRVWYFTRNPLTVRMKKRCNVGFPTSKTAVLGFCLAV